MNLEDHVGTLVGVSVSLLGVAFGYGKLAEKVKTLEDKIGQCEEHSDARLSEIERDMRDALKVASTETKTAHDRLRDEVRKDTDTLEAKFRLLASQMEGLRNEVISMRERMHSDMIAQTKLLHEIKGRLDRTLEEQL